MIRFKINGEDVNPDNMKDKLMAAALNSVKEQIHSKISSLRDPETGEAPVVMVKGKSLDKLQLQISGSEKIQKIVKDKLDIKYSEEEIESEVIKNNRYAFISYTDNDAQIAGKVVESLHSNGVQAFSYKNETDITHSFVEKISQALGSCTDFIGICSNTSLSKRWIKDEIAAAIIQHKERDVNIIFVLVDLVPEDIPPLYRVYHIIKWTEEGDAEKEILSTIFGLSVAPPLKDTPQAVKNYDQLSQLSPAAMAIVKMAIEHSTTGRGADIQLDGQDIIEETKLSVDDIIDAVQELEGQDYVNKIEQFGDGPIGFSSLIPQSTIYSDFDSLFNPWIPEDDALKLAEKLVFDEASSQCLADLAKYFHWDCRRINPAASYLISRKIVDVFEGHVYPWVTEFLRKTPATRRFVRDRKLS